MLIGAVMVPWEPSRSTCALPWPACFGARFIPKWAYRAFPKAGLRAGTAAVSTFSLPHLAQPNAYEHSARLERLFAGKPEDFAQWVEQRTAAWTHPFDLAIRDADFETLHEFWGF
jgi:hypothetical protein